MNTPDNHGTQDKTLKDELDQLGRSYQQLESEEPPELLDQAILNSAHRAVEVKTGWLDFGWIHGLATAALVVLTLSIIMKQRQPVPLEQDGVFRSEAVSDFAVGESELKEEGQAKAKRELRTEMEPQAPAADTVVGLQVDTDHAAQAASPAAPPAASPASAPVIVSETSAISARVNAPEKSQDSGQFRDDSMDAPTREVVDSALKKDHGGRLKSVSEEVASKPVKATGADESSINSEEPDNNELDLLRQRAPEAEQLLQAIVELRQSGDERWIQELESFRKRFPDYPLPESLKE